MQVHYKRDLNSNYMILTDDVREEETYELRMLTENRIYGCLPCVSQQHGEKIEYYYEITGKQSMSLVYERRKLTCDQLRDFLRDLLRVLDAAGEYLLKADHFILKPEYIYLHTKSEKLSLCYFPGYETDIRESFLELAEYLLGKLDKNDTKGIEFGYDLYQCALEPNFSLTEVLQRHTKPEKEESLPAFVETATDLTEDELLDRSSGWKSLFKKKEKKGSLDAYVEEEDMKSGSVLFLREQNGFQPTKETDFLRPEKLEGLILQSRNPEYPTFHMEGDTFLIGKRRESVDGCIQASTVSRIHARITKEGSLYFLEDLNSTNGTWAEQMQLDPYELFPLEDGMRVTFASVEYEVRIGN